MMTFSPEEVNSFFDQCSHFITIFLENPNESRPLAKIKAMAFLQKEVKIGKLHSNTLSDYLFHSCMANPRQKKKETGIMIEI